MVLDTNGVVVRDNRGNKVGRGAYICGNEDCLSVLNTGKGLSRDFKRNVSIPVF